jgi:hypothetical protein
VSDLGQAGNTCGGFNTPGLDVVVSGPGTVSDPASFIGTGSQSVEVTGSASGEVGIDGEPSGIGFFAENANGILTVNYNYTPAPEPRMPLLILTGCFLAALARNKLSWMRAALSRPRP